MRAEKSGRANFALQVAYEWGSEDPYPYLIVRTPFPAHCTLSMAAHCIGSSQMNTATRLWVAHLPQSSCLCQVNIGSGVSILKVVSEQRFERVGGSMLGPSLKKVP